MGEISQRPQGEAAAGTVPPERSPALVPPGGGSPKAEGQKCWEITPQPGLGSPCQPRLWECAGSQPHPRQESSWKSVLFKHEHLCSEGRPRRRQGPGMCSGRVRGRVPLSPAWAQSDGKPQVLGTLCREGVAGTWQGGLHQVLTVWSFPRPCARAQGAQGAQWESGLRVPESQSPKSS